MLKTAQTIAVLTVALLVCVSTSHAAVFGTSGFEISEGFGSSGAVGVGGSSAGTWADGGNTIDTSNVRYGSQAAQGAGTMKLTFSNSVKGSIQAAAGNVRLSYSMYDPGGTADVRQNGYGGVNSGSGDELWQMRLKANGDVHMQTDVLGGGVQNDEATPSTDSDNKWIDFIVDMDLSNASGVGHFTSVQYKVAGEADFTEMLSTESQFRIASGRHLNRLHFNHDGGDNGGDTRYDGIWVGGPPPVS